MIDITIPIRAQKSVKYLTLFLEKSYYFLCQSLKVYLLIKLFHIFPPLNLFFSSSRTGKKTIGNCNFCQLLEPLVRVLGT